MSDFRNWRFDGFFVEAVERRVSRAGEPVHLEPRSFEVLVHLLERRGHLVRKEELLDHVWSGAYVTEAALAKAVARVRKALGDDAHDPRFIETVPTLGYRFIAEARSVPGGGQLADATDGAGAKPTGVASAGGLMARWSRPAGLVLAALVMAVAVLWVGSLNDGDGWSPAVFPADGADVRIVVLPFQNLGDEDEAYFVDGVHDELISALTRIPRLRVISRTTASHFGANGLSVPEIADELGVDYVVEGSVLPAGRKVRINAQLVHARTDEHLWAAIYDRDLGDVLGVLSEVAAAVAAEVDVSLGPADRRFTLHQSVDPAAQEAYLRARHVVNRFQPDVKRAVPLYRRALEIEPDFVAAYSGLAFTYATMGMYGLGYSMFPPAREAAQQALRLDPRRAEAHVALGFVQMYFDRGWEEARASFERALAIDPCDPHARHGLADYLALVGRRGEAAEHARVGRQCDPFSNITAAFGLQHLYIAGRYAETITEARALLDEAPGFLLARAYLAQALWQSGRLHESLQENRRLWADTIPELVKAIDGGLAHGGPMAAQRAVVSTLVESTGDWFNREAGIAICLAYVGDAESAILWLERAEERRSDPLIVAVLTRPEFDFLRDHPRFLELRQQMGLPDVEYPATEVAASG